MTKRGTESDKTNTDNRNEKVMNGEIVKRGMIRKVKRRIGEVILT